MVKIDKALTLAIDVRAVQIANKYKDCEIKISHVLYAIIDDKTYNVVQYILNSINIDSNDLLKEIQSHIEINSSNTDCGVLEKSAELNEILNYCKKDFITTSDKGKHIKDYVSASDFLITLLTYRNSLEGVLKKNGIVGSIKDHILEVIYSVEPFDVGQNQAISFGFEMNLDDYEEFSDTFEDDEFADKKNDVEIKKANSGKGGKHIPFCENITAKYKNRSEAKPCYGRNELIKDCFRTLSRLKKGNIMLLGDAGVGKSSVVEGLAYNIARKKVSDKFLSKNIFMLDLNSLLAGTKYRGMFEKRLQTVIDFLKKDSDAILFIDEIHNIVGAGSIEDSHDMANILKPYIANGDIRVIGATTHKEYNKKIKKDKALIRRFKNIYVNQPDIESTISILEKLKAKYSRTHGVKISKKMIEFLVAYCDKFIPNRNFPDKAIDVLDDACVLCTEQSSKGVDVLRGELMDIVEEKKKIVKSQDYSNAKRIKEKELHVKQRIEAIKKNTEKYNLKEEHVLDAISGLTNSPINLNHDYLGIKKSISEYLIDKKDIIDKVIDQIKTSNLRLDDETKPISSFLFVGASGVGKTEVAKQVADKFFGGKKSLIRIDCSEYRSAGDISKLIGSSAGYVGYENDGYLSDELSKKPFSVVLFDEIEKADDSLFNLLLQVLDEGVFTNNKGDKIDFQNTIIIMTSNIGLSKINNKTIGFSARDADMERVVLSSVESFFAPEFVNRIEEVVYFPVLGRETIYKLIKRDIDMYIHKLNKRGLKMEYEDSMIEKIYLHVEANPLYGYRPYKRFIKKSIKRMIANQIDEGKKDILLKTKNI